jgi:ribose 5-phosphate isomerase B
MTSASIAIAADHHGVALKAHLTAWLISHGHSVDDRGTDGVEIVDYPVLCASIGNEITSGRADRGIMIGGSGQGEAIACNKIQGVRAGLCQTVFDAEISRGHNDANVLVLGAKVVTAELAEDIVETWLTLPFKGGVHQNRLDQIAELERGETPV